MISWQRMELRFLRSQTIRFDGCPLWVISGDGMLFDARDRGGQVLAYVYFEDEPGRRSLRET
jgi:hypothetical protein